MDRRFEGLLFSIIFHAALVWILFLMKAPASVAPPERVEVQFTEPTAKLPPKSKAKTFVEETHVDLRPQEQLKDTADFLSKFTKRVKKQIIAKQNGPTRNSKPNFLPNTKISDEPLKRSGVAGMDRDRPPSPDVDKTKGDIGLPMPGGSQAMHQVAIGPSSIAEYIPGVEVGDFTALNTDQFTYYAFFNRINEQIRSRWVQAIRAFVDSLSNAERMELSKSDRQTVVEVIIKPNGEFDSKVLEMSSGNSRLDATTTNAFVSATPFINPPSGMVESDHLIHIRYGFMVRFGPPMGGNF